MNDQPPSQKKKRVRKRLTTAERNRLRKEKKEKEEKKEEPETPPKEEPQKQEPAKSGIKEKCKEEGRRGGQEEVRKRGQQEREEEVERKKSLELKNKRFEEAKKEREAHRQAASGGLTEKEKEEEEKNKKKTEEKKEEKKESEEEERYKVSVLENNNFNNVIDTNKFAKAVKSAYFFGIQRLKEADETGPAKRLLHGAAGLWGDFVIKGTGYPAILVHRQRNSIRILAYSNDRVDPTMMMDDLIFDFTPKKFRENQEKSLRLGFKPVFYVGYVTSDQNGLLPPPAFSSSSNKRVVEELGRTLRKEVKKKFLLYDSLQNVEDYNYEKFTNCVVLAGTLLRAIVPGYKFNALKNPSRFRCGTLGEAFTGDMYMYRAECMKITGSFFEIGLASCEENN